MPNKPETLLSYYHDSLVGQLSILEDIDDADVSKEAIDVLRNEIERLLKDFPEMSSKIVPWEYRFPSSQRTERYRVSEIIAYLESVLAALRP